MPKEKSVGCATPTGGLVGEPQANQPQQSNQPAAPEAPKMMQIGKKAPDFNAPCYYQGKFASVQLSEYLGKWVVLCFYPGDFTFVCATEVSALAAKYQDFQDLGVEVLSMSVDSPFVHKMWQEHELCKIVDGGVPFPMLSDGSGQVGAAFGVYDAEGGVDVRGRFLIDPDGVVQAMEVITPSVGRNVAETLRQIKAFQLVRESGDTKVTPSGWKPGKTVLTPGEDLVGNVWKEWKLEDAFN
ncbi:thioredoxin-dependent peroxiredoxin [Desulfoferula mesophila]|uniref:Alkyl hydroperoxide reductase C n=1 Tax=Desulfoferula mesophila TaxID=3058419 RepID=A0AAU9EXB0_9BACT|nr:selenocysteine-containing peroxiredoxin PrxU [Desulfoferula mesophilus]